MQARVQALAVRGYRTWPLHAWLRAAQAINLPHGIEQQRRVGHLQQQRRIVRVPQHENATLNTGTALLQPLPCGFDQCLCLRLGLS